VNTLMQGQARMYWGRDITSSVISKPRALSREDLGRNAFMTNQLKIS